MLSLGKLSKLLPSTGRLLQPANSFGMNMSLISSNYYQSLVYKSQESFGRAPAPKKELKKKEKISAPAYSDEKVGKTSKAEEEAENKKKKAEEHKAKLERASRKVIPMKTHAVMYEAKFSKQRIEHEIERTKKKGYLFFDEDFTPKDDPKKVETKPAVVEAKPLKAYRDINEIVRKETPSLKRKTVETYFPTEDVVNKEFYKTLKSVEPHEETQRVGAIAFKVGMTSIWDRWGVRHALTVLQLDRCQVVQVKTKEKDGYNALQLGAGDVNIKRLKKPDIGHFLRAMVPPKKVLKEFKVEPENMLPVGFQIGARHFTPGQWVDVLGISQGKGFQGAMYRWNFRGQPASHGNSLSHRAMGSTGQRQDAGRVWKMKKMPGRMGGDNIYTRNLKIWKIDVSRSLVFIKGSVPGKPGTAIHIRDSWMKRTKNVEFLNCPTFIPKEGEKYADQIVIRAPEADPNEEYLHDNDIVTTGDENVTA